MRALVLCAGLGTRLRPLTERWPKPAVPLLGQPLFRSALATLVRAGVREVGINTFHLPEVMEAVARDEAQRAGVSLHVSKEVGEIQGTGGGIRGLNPFALSGVEGGRPPVHPEPVEGCRTSDSSSEPIIVLNGDVLFGVDVKAAVDAHRASGAAATMVLLPMPPGETYNAVEVDADGHVRRIAGKGPGGPRLAPWHFSGMHVLTPKVFEFMATSGPEDINKDVYVRMLEAGLSIHAHRVTDERVFWADLGTPARYAAVHRALLFGQVPLEPFGDASPFAHTKAGPGTSRVQEGAQLDDVKVAGPAFFAGGCVVGKGVRIGAGVSIGRGAKVGAGAHLNRVAVLDGAEVPAGVLYEDAIVAPGGVVLPVGESEAAAC